MEIFSSEHYSIFPKRLRILRQDILEKETTEGIYHDIQKYLWRTTKMLSSMVNPRHSKREKLWLALLSAQSHPHWYKLSLSSKDIMLALRCIDIEQMRAISSEPYTCVRVAGWWREDFSVYCCLSALSMPPRSFLQEEIIYYDTCAVKKS